MAKSEVRHDHGDDDSHWDSFLGAPAWLLVFFSNLGCGCAGFAIVLPTLWPYLREMGASTKFLALVVAMYSVGEGLGGYIIGKIYDRYPSKPKLILQSGMLVGLLAAFVYSVAPVFGNETGMMVVLASRFFSGFDNGGRQTIEQTFLSTAVPSKYLTTVSSRLSSFALTGIMFGPAFGAPLQAIDFKVPIVGLQIDGNNSPGLMLCFFCLVNLIVTSRFFNPEQLKEEGAVAGLTSDLSEANGAAVSKKDQVIEPPRILGLITSYFVFFVINCSMASLETVTPVVAQRLYGWGPCLNPDTCPFKSAQTYVNMLMTIGALLSFANCLIMSSFGSVIHTWETTAICCGLGIFIGVNLLTVDWFGSLPAGRFLASYLIGAFFGGFIRGPHFTQLSQVIGPHPKGGYMGLLFLVGALPRIVGPFVLVSLLDYPSTWRSSNFPYVYEGPVSRTWLLYGSQAGLYAIALVMVITCRHSLTPHPALTRQEQVKSSLPDLEKPLLPDLKGAAQIQEDYYGGWLSTAPSPVHEGVAQVAPLVRRLSSFGSP
eukprot:TRINITY_DN36760_c0_g1_i1.p1 TRINITY_DN36760_c0_g1~~TRINITY_DN36760_c0_g1_i1.p1  ORF type:complete len:552 (+),score=54.35 TRINITY_DN36760_c0_g1_i1:33-1658(+)